MKVTGDEGIRTLDLRIANATLSQLSYVPDLDSRVILCTMPAIVKMKAA